METVKESSVSQKKKKDRPSAVYFFVREFLRMISCSLFGLKVIGYKKNMPEEGGAIAAGNHINLGDPIMAAMSQKRQIRFMAKKELFDVPVLRGLLKALGAFPVDRGAGDLRAVSNAVKMVRNGQVLGIFPEGTRSKDGNMNEGKPGVILIAHKAQVPIYPFAVYSKGKPLSLFCKYTVAVGKPVTTAELGVTKGNSAEFQEATRRLMEIIADLREQCIKARS